VEVGPAGLLVSVTGQIVVPMVMISVVTWPRGQFVTVGGHEVMVWTEVVTIVEVV